MSSIDWPGIRLNSLEMGIRGAARAAAVNLPPDEQERFVFRVLKRAAREGWEDKRLAVVRAHLQRESPAQAKPMSSNVLNGVDSAAITLAEDGNATKLAGMEYAKLVTEHARDRARTEPEKALAASDKVKSAMQSAAIAGSWQQQGVQVGVQVSVGSMGVE